MVPETKDVIRWRDILTDYVKEKREIGRTQTAPFRRSSPPRFDVIKCQFADPAVD